MKPAVLIVDDDHAFRVATSALLEDRGYDVASAASAVDGRRLLDERPFDLLLSDVVMEGMNGLELLAWTRERHPDVTVVMITGFGSIRTAVEAMRHGAYDYVSKPCDNDELALKIERALEARSAARELHRLREEVSGVYTLENVVSRNPRMAEVFALVRRVAEVDVTALVLGETGTGKELVARAIHQLSARRDRPFVVINCSALPETLLESELFGHERHAFTGADRRRIGKFEEADGGTVFLDEIGDVPAQTQTRLLRVLQEREIQRIGGNETLRVDVRIIAATHRDLDAMRRDGTFREDLYYRLHEVPIVLPPLRDRPGDIPLLAEFFVRKHRHLAGGRVTGIAPHALVALSRGPWRGNVRELENVIKRALVTCDGDAITHVDVPGNAEEEPYPADDSNAPDLPYKEYMRSTIREAEGRYLRRLLAERGGNVSAVADAMGIDRKTVYRKLEQLGIDPSAFR